MTTPTPGLSPSESAFLAEMELVTVLPRHSLPAVALLSGATPALRPPHRAALPLWLALLLQRQGRAHIVPPPWLAQPALERILAYEMSGAAFSPPPRVPPDRRGEMRRSPPFQATSTAEAATDTLPYHWLEVAQLLLEQGAGDVPEAEGVRRLLRDLREARAAKLRKGVANLEGTSHVVLGGVGALEVAEQRGFVAGVMDGLRKIGASREAGRRERERDGGGEDEDEGEDEDMG